MINSGPFNILYFSTLCIIAGFSFDIDQEAISCKKFNLDKKPKDDIKNYLNTKNFKN